jgi:hypothetical protein
VAPDEIVRAAQAVIRVGELVVGVAILVVPVVEDANIGRQRLEVCADDVDVTPIVGGEVLASPGRSESELRFAGLTCKSSGRENLNAPEPRAVARSVSAFR